MKFILNEELTLDEATPKTNPWDWMNTDQKLDAVQKYMKNYSDYSDKEIETTINQLRNDENNGKTSELNYWLQKRRSHRSLFKNPDAPTKPRQTKPKNNSEQTPPEQGNNSDNQPQNKPQQNPQEQQPRNNYVDTNLIKEIPNDNVKNLINRLNNINPKATQQFLGGIKGQIKTDSFPFTKIMSKPEFANALFGNRSESLTEAGLGDLFSQIGKSKTASANKPITRLVRLYNAFLDLSRRVSDDRLLKYAEDPEALVYSRGQELYRIQDNEQLRRALNIDIAATLIHANEKDGKHTDVEIRNKLRQAIKTNKVNQLNTYTIENEKNRHDNRVSNNKKFNQLSPENKEKVIDAGMKALEGNK